MRMRSAIMDSLTAAEYMPGYFEHDGLVSSSHTMERPWFVSGTD
jgi:hypothetical protein